MEEAPLFKYCNACGFEYYAFVDVCTECDEALTNEPLPVRGADGGGGVHEIGEEDVGALTDDERARVALMLRGLDVPFELTDMTLTFPRSHTQEVRAQLELVGTHAGSFATRRYRGPPPILWDRRGRGLNDRIARTVVVRNRTDTWLRDEDDDDR